MRFARPVAVAAAILSFSVAATACLADSPSATVMPVPINGLIVTVGGPAPGAPAPIAGAEFRLVGAGGAVSVRADRRGRFTAELAPGAYRVRVTGHAPMANGRMLQTQPDEIIVTARHAGLVRLIVPIK